MGGGYTPPETPKPNNAPPQPPWIGKYTGRKHTGRLEWWADLNYKDEALRAGKWRGIFPSLNEEDRFWFDPKVKDGTSLSGPMGLDNMYHPDLSKKGDQPGDFYEFQKKVMKNSHQYKEIAKKWNLSEEHPGLDVNPTLESIDYIKASQFGKGTMFPSSWHHFGPRFWDKPINEGCLEKGLAMAKYAAIFTLPWTIMDLKAFPPPNMPYTWNMTCFFKRYVSHLPFPTILSFVYGTSFCAAATIRNRDDCYNYGWASAAVCTTFYTIKNNSFQTAALFAFTYLIGVLYQYSRIDVKGVQGGVQNQRISGLHAGPLSWSYLDFGPSDFKREKF